jgi:hypothetical protein
MLNHLILGQSLIRPVRSWRLKSLPRKVVARSRANLDRSLRAVSPRPARTPQR